MMDFSTKCICPSCSTEINLAKCRILSGKTSGMVLKQPPFSLFGGVAPLNGPYYTLELAHRECTVCRYLLPQNIERVPSITLVVVGDLFSGKSHYIAGLIHQLKTQWISKSTGFVRFTCLTPEIEKKYTKEYIEPLFTQQTVLQQTSQATSQYATPLIYELVTSLSPRHPTKTTNLMIYDASGEDFEEEARLVEYARFAINTNAFIFVADPFTMEPFFNNLPSHIQTVIQGRRAAERLNAIISIYERNTRKRVGGSLPGLPIAVMVSKSDMFKSLYNPKSFSFMKNPPGGYGNGIDLNDIETIDQETRRLLELHGQGDLIAATNRFKSVNFFATSSTGEPPNASGSFAKVDPCRCLDPVLWILYQLGIITASR